MAFIRSSTLMMMAVLLSAAVALVCAGAEPSTFGYYKGGYRGGSQYKGSKGGGGSYGGGGWWNTRPAVLVLNPSSVSATPADDNQLAGTTAVLINSLECDGTTNTVGLYEATGIYIKGDTDPEKARLNFQITVTLTDSCGRWPKGNIFLQGDGTGLYADSTLDKAIVGGTGPYAGKIGKMNLANDHLYFTFYNW